MDHDMKGIDRSLATTLNHVDSRLRNIDPVILACNFMRYHESMIESPCFEPAPNAAWPRRQLENVVEKRLHAIKCMEITSSWGLPKPRI